MSDIDTSDDRVSNPTDNPYFGDIVDEVASRRTVLKGSLGMAALGFFGLSAAGCDDDDEQDLSALALAFLQGGDSGDDDEAMLGFTPVAANSLRDSVTVPPGYLATAFAPLGMPINSSAPAYQTDASNTSGDQSQQVGDNHDGMHYFGLNGSGTGYGDSSTHGLLVMNHEYTNAEYLYPAGTLAAIDADVSNFTLEHARKNQEAHGVSVLRVERDAYGRISHVPSSSYNRRITGNTPMTFDGPAAGDAALQTAADPAGMTVLGTLNNCGNGYTPWGTYITCEENFNGYFGWNGSRTATLAEQRYGLSQNGFGYLWHLVDPRFDINANPNEPNRFGWIIEIDPFDPTSTPVKHTALGRFKHENAAITVTKGGHVVVYMGDDERFDYIYKFVSAGTFDDENPMDPAHRNLLSAGTLYVARFDAGATAGDFAGTGEWLPLVFGTGPLTPANGFTSQADVLIRARMAADALGATKMDRPEWVAVNPKVEAQAFCTLTNNSRRGTGRTDVYGNPFPDADEANPRNENRFGQIIRWTDDNHDGRSTTFTWDLFLIAGNPIAYPDRSDLNSGSSNITADNTFNSPDGLAFDKAGRLWIQTDGSYDNSGRNQGQGNNQMLVADTKTGEVRRFCVGPGGCEITGITWTPDRKTMFINIQHPGDRGSPGTPSGASDITLNDNPTGHVQWPEIGVRPRSATVVIRRADGGVIGAGDDTGPMPVPGAPDAVG